jgi:cephalosporin hydroxylase
MNSEEKYTYIVNKCIQLSSTYSDIHEHLPTLYNYAKECNSVIELGVRGCVSSWSFVCGLLDNAKENSDRKILFNDIEPCPIDELLYITNGLPIKVEYQWRNDLNLEVNTNYDLTFIDTWHVYGQLKRELEKFSPLTNKYIIMHDTTVDEIYGETLRMNMNAIQQHEETGFPIEEINCGLWIAVEEFLETHPEWKLKERFTNNNGLTILERVG